MLYSYSYDEETFQGEFETAKEAAANGLLMDDDSESIMVGENENHTAHDFINIEYMEYLFDRIKEGAFEKCGEISENWLFNVDQAKFDELKNLIGNWMESNYPTTFFSVRNTREFTRAELVASGDLDPYDNGDGTSDSMAPT